MQLFSRNSRIETEQHERFIIRGISCFGFESSTSVLDGLYAQNINDIVQTISDNDFNFIRLPFSIQLALNLENTAYTSGINFQLNQQLLYLNCGQILDYVVAAFSNQGLYIMFDNHNMTPGGVTSEYWYDDKYNEHLVIEAWKIIANRYKDNNYVLAADLKNEPHGNCIFGGGDLQSDWSLAATRIGNAILEICPHWLIFVQGTEKGTVACPECFWGQNLASIRIAPIHLNVKDKLVYSCHSYGPGVRMQAYFRQDGDFSYMPEIWDQQFGFIVKDKIGPAVVTGQFGGQSPGVKAIGNCQWDAAWLTCYANYMKDSNLQDNFFCALNPDLQNMSGYLYDDWSTVDIFKQNLLAAIQKTYDSDYKLSVNPTTKYASSTKSVTKIVLPTRIDNRDKISVKILNNNCWSKDGKTLRTADIILTNKSELQTFTNIYFTIQPTNAIERIWNVLYDGNYYQFPSTVAFLAPGQKYSFGAIVNKDIKVLIISTT